MKRVVEPRGVDLRLQWRCPELLKFPGHLKMMEHLEDYRERPCWARTGPAYQMSSSIALNIRISALIFFTTFSDDLLKYPIRVPATLLIR